MDAPQRNLNEPPSEGTHMSTHYPTAEFSNRMDRCTHLIQGGTPRRWPSPPNRLIINSPYGEPRLGRRCERETRTLDLVEGRRPASSVVRRAA